MNILDRIQRLKKDIEEYKTIKVKNETELKMYQDKLKDEFEIETVDEAKDLLSKMEIRLDKMEKEIKEKLKTVDDAYDL